MIGTLCLCISAICFGCAALSWSLGPVRLMATGSLFFVLGHLLGGVGPAWTIRRRSE